MKTAFSTSSVEADRLVKNYQNSQQYMLSESYNSTDGAISSPV